MAMQESSVGLPAVLVLPDWDGLNEYEFKRVHMLASMGYVALGVDIYGLPFGTVVEDFVELSAQATFWRSNPELYVHSRRPGVVEVVCICGRGSRRPQRLLLWRIRRCL
mmetsp:Transcript_21302/g.55601  ORF Transcript_21302/g.55601 Transcript_21302/m.55601 type:complete len:109 (-) Transcript_21302:75-401(-)